MVDVGITTTRVFEVIGIHNDSNVYARPGDTGQLVFNITVPFDAPVTLVSIHVENNSALTWGASTERSFEISGTNRTHEEAFLLKLHANATLGSMTIRYTVRAGNASAQASVDLTIVDPSHQVAFGGPPAVAGALAGAAILRRRRDSTDAQEPQEP
jgi:hypothetical protein